MLNPNVINKINAKLLYLPLFLLNCTSNVALSSSEFESVISKPGYQQLSYLDIVQRMKPDLSNIITLGNDLINFQTFTLDQNSSFKGLLAVCMDEANQGNVEAALIVAKFYCHGIGTDKNYEKAFEWCLKAEEQGRLSSRNHILNANKNLGFMYYHAFGVKRDFSKAFGHYLTVAELDDATIYNRLGSMYSKGLGTTIDQKKAFECYKKAAKLGDALGYQELGKMHQHGSGTTIDVDKAFKYYQKAVDLGGMGVYYNLGLSYENGSGTTIDIDKAIKCYHKAAEKNEFLAQHNLGNRYNNGDGVVINYPEAFKWFIKAKNNPYNVFYKDSGYTNDVIINLKNSLLLKTTTQPINNISSNINDLEQVCFKHSEFFTKKFEANSPNNNFPGASKTLFKENEIFDAAVGILAPLYNDLKNKNILEEGYLITNSQNAANFINHNVSDQDDCHIISFNNPYNPDQLLLSIGKTNVTKALKLKEGIEFLQSAEFKEAVDSNILSQNIELATVRNKITKVQKQFNKIDTTGHKDESKMIDKVNTKIQKLDKKFKKAEIELEIYKTLKSYPDIIKNILEKSQLNRNKAFEDKYPELL